MKWQTKLGTSQSPGVERTDSQKSVDLLQTKHLKEHPYNHQLCFVEKFRCP